MKRVICMFLIIVVLLCAVSCGGEDFAYTVLTNTPDYTAPDGVIVDPVTLSINDYSSYKKFCKNTEFFDSFVKYEDIEALGKFDMFNGGVLGETTVSLDKYLYGLIDERAYAFILYVEHYYTPEEDKYGYVAVETPENAQNLAVLENLPERAYVMVGGAKYSYMGGKLTHIEKIYGDICVTIGCSGYPSEGKDTFISQLLSTETAESAVAELDKMIETR